MKHHIHTTKEKQKVTFATMKDTLKISNPMQAPRLEKVVISCGVGSIKDKKKIALVEDRLCRITGQKVTLKGAKKSIASFKVRQGDPAGFQVTLRGERMNNFIDKLVHIAFPRTRDFRGISRGAVDEMGNITIGIKEHTIFPETSDEDIKDVFGLGITIVTTATTKAEALAYFEYLGIPFVKVATAKK